MKVYEIVKLLKESQITKLIEENNLEDWSTALKLRNGEIFSAGLWGHHNDFRELVHKEFDVPYEDMVDGEFPYRVYEKLDDLIEEEGFLTPSNKFLNREDALKVWRKMGGKSESDEYLDSNDLWE